MKATRTRVRLTMMAFFLLGGSGVLLWGFARRPLEQPIAFSHKQHIEQGATCTFCHTYAEQSARAGIPGVQQCMVCHQSIKTESPEVQKIQTYFARRQEIPWVRGYGFASHAHVYFNHQRHVAAGVDCATCHGDVAQMTVAEPVVRHTMGWCMQCHEENQSRFKRPHLANDCLTCHN